MPPRKGFGTWRRGGPPPANPFTTPPALGQRLADKPVAKFALNNPLMPFARATGGVFKLLEAAQPAAELVPTDVNNVKATQAYLNKMGRYGLAEDGVYGPQTQSAFDDFNRRDAVGKQERFDQKAFAYNAKNTALAAEAVKARANLMALADRVAKQKGMADSAKYLRKIASDPVRFDNQMVTTTYKQTVKALADADEMKRKNKPKGLKRFALNTLDAISNPIDELILQPYYSGKKSQLRGASAATSARSTVAGFPGLGFLADEGTRKDVEAVQQDERRELTDKGQLASFGEFVSGNAASRLKGEALANYKKAGGLLGTTARLAPTPVRGALSGTADFALQGFGDPLNIPFAALGALGKVGTVAAEGGVRAAAKSAGLRAASSSVRSLEKQLGKAAAVEARQAGRVAFLMNTATGKALLDNASAAVAKTQDLKSLRQSVRGLNNDVAADILSKARAVGGGQAAARGALARAFVEGTWSPTVKLKNQAAVAATGGRGLGRSVSNRKLATGLRNLATSTEAVSAAPIGAKPRQLVASAVDTSLRKAQVLAPDFYRETIQPRVAGLGFKERLNRVESISNVIRDIPEVAAAADELPDIVQSELDRLSALLEKNKPSQTPRAGRAGLRADIERGLQRLESLEGVLAGEAGDAAKAQAAATLAQSVPVRPRGFNPARGAARLALSVAEPIAPTSVRLEGAASPLMQVRNRVEALDRWAAALGADDTTAFAIRSAAEAAKTEQELYRIVRDALIRKAESSGVSGDELAALLKERTSRRETVFRIGDDHELVRDIQTSSQLVEDIPLPTPQEVDRVIRGLKASGGSLPAKVRVGIGKPFHAKVPGLSSSVSELLAAGHRQWKFNIVTNPYAALLGAGAGFATGDGLEDRLKRAATGGAIGLLGPVRYIARVAGTEEKLRYYFERGFSPPEWTPVLSKRLRRSGVDLPALSHDIVRSGNEFGNHLSNKVLVNLDPEWVALGIKEPRFVDGWFRIVNNQLNPETDHLAAIFLQEAATELSEKQARDAAVEFLKSADGQVVFSRLRNGTGGPKTFDDVIERYRTFTKDYFPYEVAVSRLEGPVTRDYLKTLVKRGDSPTVVHAQKTWVLPKGPRQLYAKVNQLAGKLVLEGPTTKMNREPMFEWLYHDEYQRLAREGVEPRRAQLIADEYAAQRTNSIMFQINDTSRFANRADFVFPFQQPREELVRVWGKLALANPGRSLKTARIAALAFNNGQDRGIFKRDDFTGEWEMSVPGSVWLGKTLFGTNVGFDVNLRDFLFFGQGAYGVNVLPSFGGPYWQVVSRAFINSNPAAYENMDGRLRELLFPYGSTGKLTRNEMGRLWMGIVGSTPPWEFGAKFETRDELNKWTKEIYLQLQYQHGLKTGNYDWEPSEAEVVKATKDFMKLWAFIGSVAPASPHPVFPTAKVVDIAREAYTNPITGEFDFIGFVTERPDLAPFLSSKTKYIGPDDMKHWTRTQEERADDKMLHYRQQKTLAEFTEELNTNRAEARAYGEREQHFNIPDPQEREVALAGWRARNPELGARTRDNYFREMDLNRIINTYPKSQQDAALDRWRREYDVSYPQYKRILEKARNAEYNPWRAARYIEDVVKSVNAAKSLGITPEVYVANLQPAEQVRYWQHAQSQLDYESTDKPEAVLDKYYVQKRHIADLFKQNPNLRSFKEKSEAVKAINKWRGDFGNQIFATYQEINGVKAAMDKAVKGKDWKNFYALKAKRTALYDHVKALRNEQYRQLPGLDEFEADVSAVLYFQKPGKKGSFVGDGDVRFITSNEEMKFLSMPPAVRTAYVDKLIGQLEIPEGKGKLFYEWLTDFQKDLLDSNLDAEQVEGYKLARAGSGGGKGGRGGSRRGGGAGGELGYAYAMFKEYNKRPDGAKAPAGYAAYLALPRDPAVRSQYLKANPAVAAWVKSGPMQNMPPVIQALVANIMIKNGKWEGELKGIDEITDVSFAREQLKRWTKREGVARPDTYDAWVNMPSGVDKALFLKDHPEVQNWIKLGPMANMPEEYRDVVRDIMQRYGEWTSKQDPLGETVAGYYKVPGPYRKKYLEDHPELIAYWAATRSPAEQAMSALTDQYYSLPAQGARRLFLAANPELQAHFLEARTKRYEKFLNKVAQYMGKNPELFEDYLQRQEDILAEMLRRFGEPNLVSETRGVTSQDTLGATRAPEGGRRRQPAS